MFEHSLFMTLGRSDQLDTTVVTTGALIFYLFDVVETVRLECKSQFALHHLKKCALLAVERLNQDGGGFCYLTETRKLEFQGSGVCNLKVFMLNDSVHRNVTVAFEKLWGEMKDEGILSSSITAASFIDLVVFLAKSNKFKKGKGHPLSQNGISFRNSLRNAVVKFLSAAINVLVMQVCQSNDDIQNRQIPSRRRKRVSDASTNGPMEDAEDPSSKRRKTRVQVDINSIWEMHEHANEIGISLPAYLQTKERERHGGSHPQACQMWLRKIHNMYGSRSALTFGDVQYLNIIADASRFSGRDTLISAAYNVESDSGAYLNNQFLRSGKIIGPDDLMLESTIEVLAAQRKVDRLAAYTLLAAISNQIKHLTQQRINITSFDYSNNTNLAKAVKPLTPNQLRIVNKDPDGAIAGVFVQEKASGEMTKINLDGADQIKVLTIGLDQGTSGMAVASFLGGTNCESAHMIHFTWDPYHRCARDMKLAMMVSTVAAVDQRAKIKNSLQRAHLCSTFLWSINYKPYNSAAFHQSKMELLEGFLNVEDEDKGWFININI